MKKVFLLLFTGFLMTGMVVAQEPKDVQGSGDISKAASRGGDPNIKVDERLNNDGSVSKAIQPTEKGARSRGIGSGYCYVTFDNHTSWYIYCYVDGYLEGYVAPWGVGDITTGSGSTCLYSVAEFDDGSRISWGPICKDCYYEDFELENYSDYYNWYLN